MSHIIADAEFERGIKRINDISKELITILNSYSKTVEGLTNKERCNHRENVILSKSTKTLQLYAKELFFINENIVKYTKEFLKDITDEDLSVKLQ